MRRYCRLLALACVLALLVGLAPARADELSGWVTQDGLTRYYDRNTHQMRTGLYAAYDPDGAYGLFYFDPADGHLVTGAELPALQKDNLVYPIGADGHIDYTRIHCAQPSAVSMMLAQALRQLDTPYYPPDGSGKTSYAKSAAGDNIGFYRSEDGSIASLQCSSLVAYCLGGSSNDRTGGAQSDGYAGQGVTLLNDLLSNKQADTALAVAGWQTRVGTENQCAFVRLSTDALQPGDVIFYNNDLKTCGCYSSETQNFSRWLWLDNSPTGASHLHVHHAALYLGDGLLLESSHRRPTSSLLRDQPDGMRLQDWDIGSKYYYPVFAVRFSSLNPSTAGTYTRFTDVPGDSWYAGAVRMVYERGLMQGSSDTEFSPGTALSRGQLLTVLYRYAGVEVPPEQVFDDVPAELSCAPAVSWALSRHIVSAGATFSPNDAVTRQQAAAFLYRFAASQGQDTGAQAEIDAADVAEISPYAYGAMAWATQQGLLSPDAGGCLRPTDPLTRAEFAVLLQRYDNLT